MRSPMPVRRIAEQETPVKIESPEEKVLREKKVAERRLRLARSPPPVRRIFKPVCSVMEPGLIIESLFNILVSFFFRFSGFHSCIMVYKPLYII